MSSVEGKVILVTGGACGVGLSYVKELLSNGAKVSAIRAKWVSSFYFRVFRALPSQMSTNLEDRRLHMLAWKNLDLEESFL